MKATQTFNNYDESIQSITLEVAEDKKFTIEDVVEVDSATNEGKHNVKVVLDEYSGGLVSASVEFETTYDEFKGLIRAINVMHNQNLTREKALKNSAK